MTKKNTIHFLFFLIALLVVRYCCCGRPLLVFICRYGGNVVGVAGAYRGYWWCRRGGASHGSVGGYCGAERMGLGLGPLYLGRVIGFWNWTRTIDWFLFLWVLNLFWYFGFDMGPSKLACLQGRLQISSPNTDLICFLENRCIPQNDIHTKSTFSIFSHRQIKCHGHGPSTYLSHWPFLVYTVPTDIIKYHSHPLFSNNLVMHFTFNATHTYLDFIHTPDRFILSNI
ncbi:hypothetical protein ES288_A08G234600v1 [Gossypium darwinii]|uniref:Uncharacterized protein n=1 Tax=Gossypium darwinii TaxID=34276 RepID=A0A5D2FPL6_GOSDA|nr:hypothetical protein ES288_A08G234600v1 [Gossypium darwinii]